MVKCTVKWFHQGKGFGFIEEDESGDVIYITQSVISGPPNREICAGDTVDAELVKGPRGSLAVTVVIP